MRGRRRGTVIAGSSLTFGLAVGLSSGAGAQAPDDPAGSAREVRVVAVDDRFELEHYASYGTFEEEARRLFEFARPELASDGRPNLVVYPESMGLWTAFLGPRGAIAREATSPEEAISSLIAAYQPQIDFYAAYFGVPPVDPTQLSDPAAALDIRTLAWALTDHMSRAMHETFPVIADEEDVWLVSCSDQSPFEATDDPTFTVVRDPEAPADSPTYVVPADAPYFFNVCWLWGPDGELIDEARKEYLVPLEQDLLDITAESVDAIEVSRTEVGRVGWAISAPAWAHEVTQRLEQLDMHVQLQPDANPGEVGGYGWANAPASLDNWQPDGWRMASWEQLSLSNSVQSNVTPMATGTVIDFVMFDGQGHVMHQPRPTDTPRAFVGSPAEPGFAVIGPWLDQARDWCPPDDPSAPLLDRRESLVDCSAQLEPGAPHQGEEVEGVVAADVILRERPANLGPAAPCGSCVAVASGASRQWTPVVTTAPDGTLHVAWRDGRTAWDGVHTDGDILAARSADGGATWSEPVRVDDGPAPSNRPDDGAWHPEIAALSDGTLVVAYEDARASENVWVARSEDGGETWSDSVRVSTTGGAPTNGGPRNGYHDLAVGPGDELVLVYHGHEMANAAARVYATTSRDGGATWTDPVTVDDTPTYEVAGPDGPVTHGVGHAWRPAVTFVGERVVIAWQDFRERRNVLRTTISGLEDLGTAPSQVVTPGAPQTRTGSTTTGWVQQFTPDLVASGGVVHAVWEDTRDGVGHVRTSRLTCESATCSWGGDEPVTAPGGTRERFPSVTASAGEPLVVLETEAGAQAWAATLAVPAGDGWDVRQLGEGLAPRASSDGAVVLQATSGWGPEAGRPDTEQILAFPVGAPPPSPPAVLPVPRTPTTGGGLAALVALALAAPLLHRRRTRP